MNKFLLNWLPVLFLASIICTTVSVPYAEAVVKFRRPLDVANSPMFNSWFDQDSRTGYTKDFTCKTGISYDKHKGVDFKATVGTTIRAGAKGGLYYRYDSCPTYGSLSSVCGNGFGNHARIDHEGASNGSSGMVSVYAHMKLGTVIGPSSLSCGAIIGQTGSSGASDGPHLHFEMRPNGFGSSPKDPFTGPCSQSTSYWSTIPDLSSGVPGTKCVY
jgi:murein DD-endopeptidase MepM/ murein hydrolase activator NlpD